MLKSDSSYNTRGYIAKANELVKSLGILKLKELFNAIYINAICKVFHSITSIDFPNELWSVCYYYSTDSTMRSTNNFVGTICK